MNVLHLATAERTDLLELVERLTPQQWASQSLCTGWSVRDVVAHVLSYEEHDQRDLVRRLRVAGFRPGRLNDVALADYADLGPQELIDFLRGHLEPQGSTAKFGGRVGLADAMVHQQDIRRPLGLPRSIPTDRLQHVLSFAVWAPPLRGAVHVRGVRVVATDVDWSHGRGPVARGPGEAVLMALAGRATAADDLEGPGADILRRRLG